MYDDPKKRLRRLRRMGNAVPADATRAFSPRMQDVSSGRMSPWEAMLESRLKGVEGLGDIRFSDRHGAENAYYRTFDRSINLGSRRHDLSSEKEPRLLDMLKPGAVPRSFVLGHEFGHHLQTGIRGNRTWFDGDTQLDADLTGVVSSALVGENPRVEGNRQFLHTGRKHEVQNGADMVETYPERRWVSVSEMLMSRAREMARAGVRAAPDSMSAVLFRQGFH